MNPWKGQERRYWPRKTATLDSLIFQINGQKLPFRFDQETIRNISSTGACLETSSALSEKSRVGVEFVLNLDRRSIRAECEIVWVRKDEANDKYLMGLRFTQISYQDRQEIEKFVQHKYSANKVMAH